MVLTLLFPGQVKAKDVIAGFSTSLFVQMAGVMYLFAIINANGTLGGYAPGTDKKQFLLALEQQSI